jgi:hypothetical protein
VHTVAVKIVSWSGLWAVEVGGDTHRRENGWRRGETTASARPRPACEGDCPAGGLGLVSAPGCTVEVGRPESLFSLFRVFSKLFQIDSILQIMEKVLLEFQEFPNLGMSVDKFK